MKNTISVVFLIAYFSSFGQKFTISSTRQNILYLGIENPIEIVIEETKCKNIRVTTSNGKIEKRNECGFVYIADSIGVANISVFIKNKNDSILLGLYHYKVKDIPNPTPSLAGIRNGEIDKNLLLAIKMISTSIESFDIELYSKVKSYCVFIVSASDTFTYKQIYGNKFTDELKEEFEGLKSGDRVYFEDIIAVFPDGIDRHLNGMSFIIK